MPWVITKPVTSGSAKELGRLLRTGKHEPTKIADLMPSTGGERGRQ
jgi:hypothetical protein